MKQNQGKSGKNASETDPSEKTPESRDPRGHSYRIRTLQIYLLEGIITADDDLRKIQWKY